MRRQGIVTGGIDPRRPASELAGMSTRELRAYTRQVNRFVSRSTQYVGLKGGVPVPRAKWDRYKKLEVRYNAKTDTFESNINDIAVAGTGMTVAQRRRRMEPDDPIKAGAARRTFERIERNPSGVKGSDALERLTKDMQRRVSPAYLDKEMRATRAQLGKMVDELGDASLREKLGSLTNSQLIVLVDGTNFMTLMGGNYAQAKAANTDTPDWQTKAFEDSAMRVHELADWAQTLPRDLNDNVTRSDDTSPRTRGSRR